jgi:asparagine synthase (glutamine-hydrolysing)
VPPEIVARKKQPYRAPDAQSFIGRNAPGYVEEVLSRSAIRDAGVFAVEPVQRLLDKCRAQPTDVQLSNSDNMALVGVLSTQLLHRELLAHAPETCDQARVRTDVDRLLRGEAA